jgi:hypothetical protein
MASRGLEEKGLLIAVHVGVVILAASKVAVGSMLLDGVN